MERYSKLGLPVLVGGLLLFIFAMKSFVNIGYGEAGVLFKTFGGGVVTDEPPKGEGFHIIAPWNDLYVYNVKQQEVFESKMQVLSSNGLDISLDISVLYQPKISELGKYLEDQGMPLAYHHHMGTVIETQEDTERLLDLSLIHI